MSARRQRKCARCGCVESRACVGGCAWIARYPDYCSACLVPGVRVLMRNGDEFIVGDQTYNQGLPFIYRAFSATLTNGVPEVITLGRIAKILEFPPLVAAEGDAA